MSATSKKVLVCGASGFIGRNIAARLAARQDLDLYGLHFKSPAPEIPGMTPLRADLTDPVQVGQALEGVDVVVQAAAATSGSKDILSQPYIHVTDNAVMNSLIFRAAHNHKVPRIIFFSCTIMYQPSDTPLKEDDFDPGQEMSPSYFGAGWTKVYVEKMCEFYSRLANTAYTVIRHSNIYGPHDKFDLEHSHVFGASMTKVLTADQGKVMVWGPGTEARDLLYVDDLVDLVEAAIERQQTPFELINAGSGQAVTVRKLVEMIIAASGRKLAIEHDLSQPHIPTSLCLDSGNAKRLFGWQAKTSLEQGIKLTMDWCRQNLYPDGER